MTHEFDGEMIDMGDGQLVTLDHRIKINGEWMRAQHAFPDKPRVAYKGLVYNLSTVTGNDDERHYILANGYTVHNIKFNEGSEDRSYEVTVTGVFRATTAGVSSATATASVAWRDGVGATVADGTVVWTNIGSSFTWAANIGATTAVSLAQTIVDSNGNLQTISTSGKSGAVAPTWKTAMGASTTDNVAVWLMAGPYSGANTTAWIYGFAFKNSVDNAVSTCSPLSDPIVLGANKLVTLQGSVSPDSQSDTIQIYRTAQGGSIELLLDEIEMPSSGTWTYTDISPDDNLGTTEAQIANSNDPPPTGAINLEYHLGRIFVSVGNTVYYAAGPDTTNGNGNQAFPPLNSFIFPSRVIRKWSTSIGLIVFTVSDTYIILGKGTSSSGFYAVKFLGGLGLSSYDAFTVFGSTAYMMTTSKKVISFDPGAGVTEVGFPIGDIFDTFDPADSSLTWHEGGSGDSALYVSNNTDGWYRMAPISAPETGFTWSPKATIVGSVSAVQSVETSPGVHTLLVGPSVNGPILQRDNTVNRDNGTAFPMWADIGSITLAHHGQLAEVAFLACDSIRVGARPTIGLRIDEISGSFSTMRRTRQDPPLLPPSVSLFNDRYHLHQNQQPVFMRHMQIRFTWATENAANELLSYTIFGAMHQTK
jgi:hypothetical protein